MARIFETQCIYGVDTICSHVSVPTWEMYYNVHVSYSGRPKGGPSGE